MLVFFEDTLLKRARVVMSQSRAITVRRELDRLEQGPRVAYGYDPAAGLEATKWNRPG